jgi:hypothetical protein
MLLVSSWALASCSDLTKVTNTGIVQPSSQNSATGAAAYYAGGVKLFVGAAQNAFAYSGTFADELASGGRPNTGVFQYLDSRRPGTPVYQTGDLFNGSSSALIALRFAANALKAYAPAPASRIGFTYTLQGYLELFLAEEFCNGIPFSTVDANGNVVGGSATPTVDVYNRAIAHFDSAQTLAADSTRILNLARIAKGRALLGLGRFADAAAAVQGVPTTYTFNLDINSAVSGQTNSIYPLISGTTIGVNAGTDGANGINWLSAKDPRVPVNQTPVTSAFDGVTPVYSYIPVSGTGSVLRLANGIEARLIEAEAALQANHNDASTSGTGWLGILNTLRATALSSALPALSDPGSYDARVNLLFRERAAWLYLTGNRMADLRRLVRQYSRTQDTVFPSGTYRDGSPFGTEVNLVPPNTEQPNVNYAGCIDRNA